MSLMRLIYTSKAADTVSLSDIANIWSTSMKKNKKNDICGLLLYKDKRFIQVLEGEKNVVSELYEAIKKDKRHVNVKLLGTNLINNFGFNQWSMGYVFINKTHHILTKYLPKACTPEKLTYEESYKLLKELSETTGAILDIEIPLNQLKQPGS